MGTRSFKRAVGLNGVYNEVDEFMAGQIIFCGSATIPAGYLECNGAAVSRTTYATLFGVIGSTYGPGDGATTFNLPDLRGEFPRFADRGRGVDTGRVIGSAQLDAMQGHRHKANPSNYEEFARYGAGALDDVTGAGGYSVTSFTTTGNADETDGANGTPRTGAETRPRNVALVAAIKY